MTPEFRNALYEYKYDSERDGAQQDCIPYQLQKLFANLQIRASSASLLPSAASTKPLTRAFGWKDSDGLVQNDVNELCRVLLDACERTMQGTRNQNLVRSLYEGRYFDYLRLTPPSGAVRGQMGTFSDLTLVIKPFGSEKLYGSVEEMLDAYQEPELLDGENKVFCDNLQDKVAAYKGLKITQLPYILTLAFKRFDFDPVTAQRKKINSEVRFPYVLDMNKHCVAPWRHEWHSLFSGAFKSSAVVLCCIVHRKIITSIMSRSVSCATISQCVLSFTHRLWFEDNDHESHIQREATSKVESKGGIDGDEEIEQCAVEEEENEDHQDDLPLLVDYFGIPEEESATQTKTVPKNASGADVDFAERIKDPDFGYSASDGDAEHLSRLRQQHGPYVYELYSVIIHQGTVTSGHYYAFIKNFKDSTWYRFDDTSVTPIAAKDIAELSFGGPIPSSVSGCASDSSSLPPMGSEFSSFMSKSTWPPTELVATRKVSSDPGHGDRFDPKSCSRYNTQEMMKEINRDCNAYQVAYRRFEPSRNEIFANDTVISEPLRAQIEKEVQAESKSESLEKMRRQMISCNTRFCPDGRYAWHDSLSGNDLTTTIAATPAPNKSEQCDNAGLCDAIPVNVLKTDSIEDVKRKIADAWGLIVLPPLEEEPCVLYHGPSNKSASHPPGEVDKKVDVGQQENASSERHNSFLKAKTDDFRLWEWDEFLNVPKRPLLTINDIFSNIFTPELFLEQRAPGSEFSHYNHAKMTVFVRLFVTRSISKAASGLESYGECNQDFQSSSSQKVEHDYTEQEACFSSKWPIYISRNARLDEIKKAIVKVYGLENDIATHKVALRVMKMNNSINSSKNSKVMVFLDTEQTLGGVQICEGDTLYVERIKVESRGGGDNCGVAMTAKTDNFDNKSNSRAVSKQEKLKLACAIPEALELASKKSPAVRLYFLLENRASISFNPFGSTSASLSVLVDKRREVRVLRNAIAKAIGVEPLDFKIKRSHLSVRCLQDTEKLLSLSSVYIEPGRELLPGEVMVRIGLLGQARVIRGDPDSFGIVRSGWVLRLSQHFPISFQNSALAMASHPLLIRKPKLFRCIWSFCGALWFAPLCPLHEESLNTHLSAKERKVRESKVSSDEKEESKVTLSSRCIAGYDFSIGGEISSDQWSELFTLPVHYNSDVSIVRRHIAKKLYRLGMLVQTQTAEESTTSKVAERTSMSESLSSSSLRDDTIARVRIAKVHKNKFTMIYRDGTAIGSAGSTSVYQGMRLGVTILSEAEFLDPDSVLVQLVYWDRASWTCGIPVEIVMPKLLPGLGSISTKFNEQVRALAGFPSSEEEQHLAKESTRVMDAYNCKLRVAATMAKIDPRPSNEDTFLEPPILPSLTRFQMVRFGPYQEFDPHQLDAKTKGNPRFYIVSEGDTFVVYDAQVKLRDLTEAECAAKACALDQISSRDDVSRLAQSFSSTTADKEKRGSRKTKENSYDNGSKKMEIGAQKSPRKVEEKSLTIKTKRERDAEEAATKKASGSSASGKSYK